MGWGIVLAILATPKNAIKHFKILSLILGLFANESAADWLEVLELQRELGQPQEA